MLSNTEFRDKSTRSSIPTIMVTSLLSADSDSINLVDLNLLDTLTTVNDNGSLVKADDLLDLELESTIFNQFTSLPYVLRVSYKGVCNSQAVQSWVSQELCCKGLCRSNNNSSLLGITRPASTGTPSLPEIDRDDDPLPERQLSPAPGTSSFSFPSMLPAILQRQLCWPAANTKQRILDARDQNNSTCHLCQQIFTTPRRLEVHMLQHFKTTFCACGKFSYHSDYIIQHQRTMGYYQGYVFDVDQPMFAEFFDVSRPPSTGSQ